MMIFGFEGQNFFDESPFRENPNPIVFFLKKKKSESWRDRGIAPPTRADCQFGEIDRRTASCWQQIHGVTLSKAEILQPGTGSWSLEFGISDWPEDIGKAKS